MVAKIRRLKICDYILHGFTLHAFTDFFTLHAFTLHAKNLPYPSLRKRDFLEEKLINKSPFIPL